MAELRLEVLLEAERTGLTVTEICERCGISRQTYYRYRRRYLAEGLPGLEDRSRRPHHPANQIPADLEVRIVGMRTDHPRWGARRIRSELARAGVDPPVVSTIHQVLSDNGLIFTGRLHGSEVAFEVSLKDLGVELINSAPYHPQTLGKLERFHRTVKEWLHDEGPAETLEHLQELLDGFRFHYNRRRPHQGIGDATPAERYGVAPINPDVTRISDSGEVTEPAYPPGAYVRKVAETGTIGWRGKLVYVGANYATANVRVIEVDRLVHIYHGDDLIRALTIDPDRRYQRKQGGRQPPQQRRSVT